MSQESQQLQQLQELQGQLLSSRAELESLRASVTSSQQVPIMHCSNCIFGLSRLCLKSSLCVIKKNETSQTTKCSYLKWTPVKFFIVSYLK